MCREPEIREGVASCALQADRGTHGIAGKGAIDRGVIDRVVVHRNIDGKRPRT